jgi:hypothetical protein
MRKGNGGLIGPLNNPTQSVAAGIWSMDEQQQSLGARQWPGTPAASKPNPPSFANSCTFTASISSNTMTVSAIATGALAVGQVISGVGVTQYTMITAQLTGTTGSTGTYTVSIAQSVSSTSMSSTVTITSVVSANSSVQIPYVLGYDGGSPVTAVTAKVYQGSTLIGTASGTSSPLTVAGLPNSVVYSPTLTATNAIGTSTASTGPYFRTPAVPSEPTIGTATVTGVTASVVFTAATNNNGTPITSYTAVSSPGGITGTGTTSPISVPGLSSSTTYTFTVYATNVVGNGPSSAASNSVTTAAATSATYLLIGAGGGGSYGGGGAGQVQTGTYSVFAGNTYTVACGTGGTGKNGGVTPGNFGGTGTSSSVFGFTSVGGGGGGGNTDPGQNGASGGGAGASASVNNLGGVGSAGNNGGRNVYLSNPFPSGGGGGAGAVGQDAQSANVAGAGGNGVTNSITGTSLYWGGGGGGASYNNQTGGAAGLGGGGRGAGSNFGITTGDNGVAGSGGGAGGGTAGGSGGNGGAGGVIIRLNSPATSTTGSPTLYTDSSTYWAYQWTGAGSITI